MIRRQHPHFILGCERNLCVPRISTLNGLGMKGMIEKHFCGQPTQQVKHIVVEVWREDLASARENPIRGHGNLSSRAIPEEK